MARSILYTLVLTCACLALFTAVPGQSFASETRLTITFAGATVVGGVYIFIAMTLDTELWLPLEQRTPALFHHDANGWQIGCPPLKLTEDGESRAIPYLDILHIEFY